MGNKIKFRIIVEKLYEHQWSFGVGVSHWETETFLYINIFHRTIRIGKLLGD